MKFNLPPDYDIAKAEWDGKNLSFRDFLCAHPKLIEVLIWVLPIAKIFCGKVLKLVIDVLILKLRELNCNN